MGARPRVLLMIAVIFYGSQSSCQVQLLENVARKFQVGSTALGTFSRSKIVSTVSQQMRGDSPESVQEALSQALVTLAVLDVGGGAIVPLTSKIVEVVTTDSAFAQVAQAMKEYGDPMVQNLDNLRSLDDQGLTDLLKAKKMRAIRLFDRGVNRLGPTHRALRHIKKAKRWLRVRSAGKVLGPLFDVVSIGVNGWALGAAIRDCAADAEACNSPSMIASSLSIAAGLVGVGTFVTCLAVSASAASVAGPVGAIVGFTLAITATLIELFWRPGPTQAQLDREQKERLMRELDRISRLQLFNVNKFLGNSTGGTADLYVANQGHLPKWFPQHPNTMQFGNIPANQPRRKMVLRHSCARPVFGNGPVCFHCNYASENYLQCPYLEDGQLLRTTRTNEPLGYGFYGFTKSDGTYIRSHRSHHSLNRPNPPDPPYSGTILLIGTDQVQPDKLAEYENMQANLKGLNINTGTKSGAEGDFDDIIAIADMPSLDGGERVIVRTGSGNDALNIDGRLGSFSASNVLDADLGTSGHNTLSFQAMATDSPITGIKFNARDGSLHFKHGRNGIQRVGTVTNVEILAASPFNDYIKMYAGSSGDDGYDFTVFKFKGYGTYEVDIAGLTSQTEARHFKIVDGTDISGDCADHIPLLKLINFDMNAVANDVLFQDNKIKIYGSRASKRQAHFNKLSAAVTASKKSDKRSALHCSGEQTDGSHARGGTNGKVLLATISIELYSECPFRIETTNVQGSCMMSPKMKLELDLEFFGGKKLFADFSGDVNGGTQDDDHCYLRCPSARVTESMWIRLNGGTGDKVIISSELFFEPCGIDGERVYINLSQANHGLWYLVIQGNDDKFMHRSDANTVVQFLQGVEQIVNEYGDLVVDLTNSRHPDYELYTEYSRVTMNSIAAIEGRERTPEVQRSLLQCMKRQSKMSPEELEICRDRTDN